MWQLRGRQVCTSGAEGAAAPEYHWGHHLLTAQHHCCSCPHTESQQQAHLLPCLPCWSLFLPSGLLETGWEQQLRRSPLPQACPPFPYILSPHLPLALQLCLHPTHPFTFLHLSPPCLHWWWQMADSYLSHISLHITLLTQASFVTIILFSCSNPSLEFVLSWRVWT